MEYKATVYVISQDNEFSSFLKKHLLNDFSLLFHNQESEIIEQLLRKRPDGLIINAGKVSPHILERLADIQHWCEKHFIPIFMVVNRFERSNLTSYLEVADAVFTHPLHSEEFVASLTKHMNKRTHFLTHTLVDSLTGAYNEQNLLAEAKRQFDDMKRSHEPLTFVYLQVDSGQVGASKENELVRLFVTYIKNSIRPTDFLGNYQSSQGFVLVLPKTVKEDARKLLDRLHKRLLTDQIKAFFLNEPISFSARIVEVTDPTKAPEEWLRTLPVKISDEPVQIVDEAFGIDYSGRKKLKIAIIDDDRLIRELLKHQLEEIGEEEYDVEIRSFADGEEFFEDSWHHQNERFLLIIDRVMPKMDGLEVLAKIRSQYDRKRYLCLMLTSKGSEADIALAIQKGANDYMTKPFSLKELQVRIKRLLRGTR